MKNGPNWIYGFVKIWGQKDLRIMKKGVNRIDNQGENWYKMLQNGQMKDFGEKVDQF